MKKVRPETLAKLAAEAMRKAYAPYSLHTVGAALLCGSGKIYTGCNIESASYSPTCCAERTAIFKAVSEGERDFEAIAVAGGREYTVSGAFPPCGVCRQVMAEFCGPEFRIYVCTADGYEEYTLEELLPHGFGSDNLTK